MNTGPDVPETAPRTKWKDPDLIVERPRPRNPLIRMMNSVNAQAARDVALLYLGPQVIALGLQTIAPAVFDVISAALPETAGFLSPLSSILRGSNPALQSTAAGISSLLLFGK